MNDNKEYTEVFDVQSTPLAREHAKRAARRVKRRKKKVSKTTRYLVSVLVIVFAFFLAFSAGRWMINLFTSETQEDISVEDPVTTLQKRLDELTSENKALSDEIKELQSQLDKYNELYGPLDNSGNPVTEESQNATESGSEAFSSEPDGSEEVSVEEL